MTTSDNGWQRVIQRVTANTTSCNEWQLVVQRVTTSATTSGNEWKRVTTNDNEWYNEWQQVTISVNFYFFKIREEPTTKHLKEISLNIEEDPWRRSIKLRAETSPQDEILTVRRRNDRTSCSQIFVKISVFKNFAISTGKHLCRSLFLRKLQVLKPASLLKADSSTGVFLWILRHFQ